MCLNGDTVGGRTVTSKLDSENEDLRRLHEIQVSGNKYVVRAGQLDFQLYVISRSSIGLYGGSFIFEGTSWMYVMEDDDSVPLDKQGKAIGDFVRLVHDMRRTMRDGLSRRSSVNIRGNDKLHEGGAMTINRRFKSDVFTVSIFCLFIGTTCSICKITMNY